MSQVGTSSCPPQICLGKWSSLPGVPCPSLCVFPCLSQSIGTMLSLHSLPCQQTLLCVGLLDLPYEEPVGKICITRFLILFSSHLVSPPFPSLPFFLLFFFLPLLFHQCWKIKNGEMMTCDFSPLNHLSFSSVFITLETTPLYRFSVHCLFVCLW